MRIFGTLICDELPDFTPREERRLIHILKEYKKAQIKHPVDFHNSHEGYAVLKEEVDELWDDIKANNAQGIGPEAAQVGAMALRFLTDLTYE